MPSKNEKVKLYFVFSVILLIGDFNDPHVVVWNTNTQLLEVSSLAEYPIHEVCWDPQQCSSFTTVGENGTVLFWMVDEKTDQRVELLLYQPKIGPQITEMTKTDTVSYFLYLSIRTRNLSDNFRSYFLSFLFT